MISKNWYHHCYSVDDFVGTTFFNTHMHKTFTSRKSLTIFDPSWSSLEEFEFWRFYGILHKNWQCWSDVILPWSDTSQIFTSELYFFSVMALAACRILWPLTFLIPVHLLLLKKPSSFCVTNTFQSISRAIAVWSGKQQTSKWLKKQLKWISMFKCFFLSATGF